VRARGDREAVSEMATMFPDYYAKSGDQQPLTIPSALP
jgi:hypothetical protein